MKKLLLTLALLTSMSVQADMTCGELNAYIQSSLTQVDAVWTTLEVKKHLYMSTTQRLFPNKKTARKEDYEKYAVIYNNVVIVHNQQVQLYRDTCK